ncbi:unnamed protein product [Adineta steineri]|uniref:Uncharacterized protein n=1 Tax=Adineta steineri TaxID=433720 RepID=A0A815QYT3_9BILA|nr:unnamed protein product [Adineta steineri]CAF4113536.1 unnamed protein product [Adineta steineri]
MARVFIFPSGSAVADEVCAALRSKRMVSELIGVSSNEEGKDLTNPLIYDHVFYNAPTVNESSDEKWINYLVQFEWTHAIPTMDSAVLLFAKLASLFPKKFFLAPNLETCNICFSKRKTYLTWPSISPKLYDHSKTTLWYVKPDVGYASRGCKEVTYEEADEFIKDSHLVVCERLIGDEFTIHCYFNCLIGARQRTLTKNGMSMLSHNSPLSVMINEMFNLILKKIEPPPGPWFFQIKGNCLLEVQPRIPGAGSAARYFWNHNGILQWIYDTSEKRVPVSPVVSALNANLSKTLPIRAILKTFQDYVFLDEDQFMLKTVIVDYDDTLFDNKTNSVDSNIIGALYAIHRKCPIYLVTRHSGNLLEHLKRHAISCDLFEQIIHVSDKDQTKWESCAFLGTTRNYSLLIDDSYRDRREWQSWSCDRDEGATVLQCWKSYTKENNFHFTKTIEKNNS